MQSRFTKLATSGVAAAFLATAFAGAAFAQTPAATPVPPRAKAEELLNAFAGKLGKSAADVRAAVVAVQKERVATDLAAGRITQAQATEMNQRIDAAGGLGFLRGGKGPGGPGGHGPRGGGPGVRGGGAEMATFLGVQPADVATALRSGKSLAAYAIEKGKTRDQLKAFLTSQRQTHLGAAVAAGRLTQAQADARLAVFNSNLDQMIDRVGPAGGPGGRDGGRGPRGGGPGFGPGSSPSAVPTAAARI